MSKNIKLKRVVIKEELVELTGNYKLALVLNQLLYWTERVGPKRYNLFAKEEKNRNIEDTDNLKGGWVYKKAEEIADELMIGVTPKTARNWLKELEDQDYILSRKNPKQKWNHTKEYRVNLLKIQSDLQDLGFNLEGYINIFEDRKKSQQSPKSPKRNNFGSERNNYDSERNNFGSKRNNYGTITEITSDNTTKIEEEEGQNFKNEFSKQTLKLFKQIYDRNIQPYELKLIKERKLSEEVIHKALELTGTYNGQTLAYLLNILDEWKRKGISTVEGAEAEIKRYKQPDSEETMEAAYKKGYR